MSLKQKINFGENMHSFTERKIQKALQLNGKILPVSVVLREKNMITVKFELTNIPYTLPEMTVPLFGPQYIRYPMQPGDRGIVIPADAYLGGVSGQGGGIADLTPPGNLSALVFLPISYTEWEYADPDTLVMYGPDGVILRDQGSKCTFILTPDSVAISAPKSFKVTVGGTSVQLTPESWAIYGDQGTLQDSGGSTNPAMMKLAWDALKSWANNHTHISNGEGEETDVAGIKLEEDISK